MTHPIKTPLFSTEPEYNIHFHDRRWGPNPLKHNLVRGNDNQPLIFKTVTEAEVCISDRSETFGSSTSDYTVVEAM